MGEFFQQVPPAVWSALAGIVGSVLVARPIRRLTKLVEEHGQRITQLELHQEELRRDGCESVRSRMAACGRG